VDDLHLATAEKRQSPAYAHDSSPGTFKLLSNINLTDFGNHSAPQRLLRVDNFFHM